MCMAFWRMKKIIGQIWREHVHFGEANVLPKAEVVCFAKICSNEVSTNKPGWRFRTVLWGTVHWEVRSSILYDKKMEFFVTLVVSL